MKELYTKQLLEVAIQQICFSTGCKYVSLIVCCHSDKPELPNMCGFRNMNAAGDIVTFSAYPDIVNIIKNRVWDIAMLRNNAPIPKSNL